MLTVPSEHVPTLRRFVLSIGCIGFVYFAFPGIDDVNKMTAAGFLYAVATFGGGTRANR